MSKIVSDDNSFPPIVIELAAREERSKSDYFEVTFIIARQLENGCVNQSSKPCLKDGGIMYCSSCGAHADVGLRFCKRCGGSLIDTNPLVEITPPAAPSRLTGAAWAIALATTAITLGGLGIVFSHVTEIVNPPPWSQGIPRHPGEFIPVAIPMIVFGTTAIFFIVFMLLRLFIRLMNLPPEPSRSAKNSQAVVNQYRPSQMNVAPPHQIHAPPISVPSVTEHTTRNFDPVYSRQHSERE